MKSNKNVLAGVGLGLAALALLTPTLASGNARTIVGSGAAAAKVAKPFIAQLSGANEVPAGDPDGDGAASVTIDPVTGEICYDLRVANIATAAAAHIHRGAAGINGPVVVPFAAPTPTSSGCVAAVPALAAEIAGNPSGFYVNVHTGDFPGGAVRGQLVLSASTSGDTQLLNTPLRVYDSRIAPEVILASGTTRVVGLAKSLGGGVAVPPGATGAVVRVTVTDTTGAGFLAVYSNALAAAPGTSNVNWYEAGAITGADLTVAVDAEAKVKVTAGGGSSTHVVIDVVGYVF